MDEREPEVREHRFEDDGRIPNDSQLPLLVYLNLLGESETDPARCKEGGEPVNAGGTIHKLLIARLASQRPVER